MTIFCLDTTAFIEPWVRRYPIDAFPTYWERVDEWANGGHIVAPDEVLREVEKIEDDLYRWVRAREFLFQPPDEDVQRVVTHILRLHPRLVDSKKRRSIADPWVIALAQLRSAVVVSEESPSGGKSPKIPDVCGDLATLLRF